MDKQENKRLGPIVLAPGVSHFNAFTFLYAAFIAIAMLAGMNFLQPYLLSTHLELPNADMGKVTGTLAIITEIVTVIFIVPIGAFLAFTVIAVLTPAHQKAALDQTEAPRPG